jgi:hypothetical protein
MFNGMWTMDRSVPAMPKGLMHMFSNRLRIARSWLASFFRREWRPEHYPIRVREQAGVPDEARWCAYVLSWPGPVGLGRTGVEARAALEASLRDIARKRREDGKPVPRPGTGLPIRFASTERIDADPALLGEFITRVLGFGADDPVFISDESTIGDFGDADRVSEIRSNIQEHFGVTVDQSDPVRIADVLERIRERREA